MAKTNAERQAKYRARKRAEKKTQVCGWLNEKQLKQADKMVKKHGLNSRTDILPYLINSSK